MEEIILQAQINKNKKAIEQLASESEQIAQEINSGAFLAQGFKRSTDFLSQSNQDDWTGEASGGYVGYVLGTFKHPGIRRFSSHASTANSGGRFFINPLSTMLIGGGEKYITIFRPSGVLSGVTRRFGFHSSFTHVTPVNGVYFEQSGNILSGKADDNNIESVTPTTYTMTANTWYRAVLEINSDATLATFTLYADDSDTVLWTDTVNANIPKTTGREVGVIDVCTLASPSSEVIIGFIDYIEVSLSKSRRLL